MDARALQPWGENEEADKAAGNAIDNPNSDILLLSSRVKIRIRRNINK